ncbi:MAG TPA: DUF2927 domain-containing protein [Actinoplanes sp.]|nr:DUF2927 domain-containing protein [Actinoplanes sp.]
MAGVPVGGESFRLLSILLGSAMVLAACVTSVDAVPGVPVTSPVPVTPSATVVSAAPPVVSPSAPVKPRISKAGLAYFLAVGFGTEYEGGARVVTRWDQPLVTVRVHGGNARSRRCLNTVISDFNALTEVTDLKVITNPADIELHFAPVSKFRSIEPKYVPGNDGYFRFTWTEYAIWKATVLIRSTGISEKIRCHLIREELTQTMGLGKDSNRYPDSVFFGEYYSAPTRYSALDEELIRLLYSEAVRPGDSRKAVTRKVTVE